MFETPSVRPESITAVLLASLVVLSTVAVGGALASTAASPGSADPGADSSSGMAAFQNTTALSENQTEPDSLSGKFRVESVVNGTDMANETTVELVRNTSENYTIDVTAPEDVSNVTFYVQTQAVSSSQDVENLTAYLDGEELNYTVDESAGPGASPWIAFEIPHFSTRTVTFRNDSVDSTSELSAAFSANDSSPTVNETVAFNGSASTTPSGNITTYAWDFDDDGAADDTGETVTHAFASTGEHNVTLTVTNESGATASTTGAIEVLPPLPPLAAFQDTTALSENQTEPDSLSGKFRVESTVNGTDMANETTIELVRDSSENYTINITAPEDVSNVTFYVQTQAVSSSQDVENLTMYLDGEEHDFEVDESAGPGASPWIAFQIRHFSTRTVTFTDGSSAFSGAAARYNADGNAAIDIGELGTAASDFVSGSITITELGEVAAAYVSS